MIPTEFLTKMGLFQQVRDLHKANPNDSTFGSEVRKLVIDYNDGKYMSPSSVEFDSLPFLKRPDKLTLEQVERIHSLWTDIQNSNQSIEFNSNLMEEWKTKSVEGKEYWDSHFKLISVMDHFTFGLDEENTEILPAGENPTVTEFYNYYLSKFENEHQG